MKIYTRFLIFFLLNFWETSAANPCLDLFYNGSGTSYYEEWKPRVNELTKAILENLMGNNSKSYEELYKIVWWYHEDTALHSERVSNLAVLIGEVYGLDAQELEELRLSGALHDIGKLKTHLTLLNGTNPVLSKEELEEIHHHPEDGFDLAEALTNYPNIRLGISDHHEKFNGTGYPWHKSGEDISLFGRIIEVADVFDAITVSRSYQGGRDPEVALQLMRTFRDMQHYDPTIFAKFEDIADKIIKLYRDLKIARAKDP